MSPRLRRWGRHLRSEQVLGFAITLAFVTLRLLLLEIAGRRIAPDAFGLFVTNRRWVSTLQPLWMMGLPLILIRWIAQGRFTQGMLRRVTLLILGATTSGLLIGLLWPGPASALLFGAVAPSTYAVLSLAVGAGGMALYSTVQVAYQGLGLYRRMHAWQLLVGGIAPTLAIAALPAPSATMFITACLVIDWVAVAIAWPSIYRQLPAGAAVGFPWRIGWPQVPPGLGLALLLNAPTAIATHALGIVAGGQFAVGTMMIGLVGNLFSTMTRRIVPFAARASRAGRRDRLHRLAWQAVRPTLALASVLVTAGWGAALAAIHLGLLKAPVPITLAAMLLSAGAVPYAVYIAMRGFVDGVSDIPLNAESILWAWWGLLVTAPIAWLWPYPTTVAVIGTINLAILASATYWQATGRELPPALPRRITAWLAAAAERCAPAPAELPASPDGPGSRPRPSGTA